MTIGYQHSPREKVFTAVIDSVEVKRVKEISPRDIEHDNPEFRRTEETAHFLEQEAMFGVVRQTAELSRDVELHDATSQP